MKKPNRQITDALEFHKYENHMFCSECKQNDAHFTYLKTDHKKDNDFLVHMKFNCSGCGHDFEYVMNYEKLRQIYFMDELSGNEKTWWTLFQLGLYFKVVFQFEPDQENYVKMVCRLNKDTSGIRKHYYRKKYGTN